MFEGIDLVHFYEFKFKSTHSFPGHRHRRYEVNVVFGGRMEVTCEGEVYTLGAGDFLLIPKDTFHRNRIISSDTAKMSVIEFTLEGDAPISPTASHLTKSELSLLNIFQGEIESSCKVCEGKLMQTSECAKKLLFVFLSYISSPRRELLAPNGESSAVYEESVRFMQTNIDKNLTIQRIAKEAGVCATTLKKAFSRYTGMGVSEFFGDMKLDEARKMLQQGTPCSEVSDLLGFSSAAYFSTKFKRKYGYPPSKI